MNPADPYLCWSEMTEVQRDALVMVRDRVNHFLCTSIGFHWQGLARDTGGAGLCWEACEELKAWWKSHADFNVTWEAVPLTELAGNDTTYCGGDCHGVLLWREHGLVVDLTARQFMEVLAFPAIYLLDRQHEEVEL